MKPAFSMTSVKTWIICLATCLYTFTVSAQNKKIEPSCPYVLALHKNGETQNLRYAANRALTKTDTTIKTLLIYIHGINRNGLAYFGYAEDMLSSTKQKKQTLLIAPQFAHKEDLDYYGLNSDFLYWKKVEWKDGDASVTDRTLATKVQLSSYEVLDSLVAGVINSHHFPNIKKIIIVGHSAGGQFVQRYSAITPIPDKFQELSFRFIVMDPSSYLYPDKKRPVNNTDYAIPDTTGCDGYNNYPKGLNKLNTYAKATGAQNIVNNMLHRDIIILLGEKDTRTDDPNLDITCAANLQGINRLERGTKFVAYLNTMPAYGNKANFAIIPGSGHNGDTMINSAEAKKRILDLAN